jgi:thiamine-monophosphate kinase
VTGTIGDAALGLKLRQEEGLARQWQLTEKEREHLAARYLLPQPRVALIDALRAAATAAMDVSDGLAGDLGKLCEASAVTADIETDEVPLSAAARRALAADPTLLADVLSGGDDYEILCAVPAGAVPRLVSAAREAGVEIAEIGRIAAGDRPPQLRDAAGRNVQLAKPSFSHF